MTPVASPARLGRVTLTPRWRKAVLTLHVITSVGWLGTDFVLLTLGIAGLSGADPAVVYPAMGLIGTVLFIPLSVVVWVIGVFNAWATPWRLLTHWWVVAKLIVTTFMLGMVLLVLRPQLQDALALGLDLPRRQRLSLVAAPIVSSSLLVFATILSTYKPWGRVRRVRPGGGGPAF
jgi:hypothetical protein